MPYIHPQDSSLSSCPALPCPPTCLPAVCQSFQILLSQLSTEASKCLQGTVVQLLMVDSASPLSLRVPVLQPNCLLTGTPEYSCVWIYRRLTEVTQLK